MNKRFLQSLVPATLLALAFSSLVGCASTAGNGSSGAGAASEPIRPAEIVPTPRRAVSTKSPAGSLPITIVKAVPTISPAAKSRRVATKSVPFNTTIPFYFSIPDAAWPAGIDFVDVTAMCKTVKAISHSTLSGYQLTTNSPALSVFPSGTSISFRINKGVTSAVNLTFPATLAGKQLFVGTLGNVTSGTDTFNFQGGDVLVINY